MELQQTETFRKWENKIKDKRIKGIIAARLFRLANGIPGDVQSVGDGVSELRIHFGAGYRIYFKQHDMTIILLLCGGDKSTQATDIKLAKRLAKEV